MVKRVGPQVPKLNYGPPREKRRKKETLRNRRGER